MKVKTGLVTGGSERIAFAIVPVEVRYPDRIVGIALLLRSSSNKGYKLKLCTKEIAKYPILNSMGKCICTLNDSSDMYCCIAATTRYRTVP